MKITTAQLDAFSAVLDLGTATAAASVLNTSQPSITRAIKQLEDATGLLLFKFRGPRRLCSSERTYHIGTSCLCARTPGHAIRSSPTERDDPDPGHGFR